MEWKRISREEDVLAVLPYLRQSEIRFCDYSAGVRFMWREAYRVDYAIINDTLLMKETTDAYRDAFFCPIGRTGRARSVRPRRTERPRGRSCSPIWITPPSPNLPAVSLPLRL